MTTGEQALPPSPSSACSPHHPGAHLRRGRRPHEVRGVGGVRADLAAARVRPDLQVGVRRLARPIAARSTSPAARRSTSTPASPRWPRCCVLGKRKGWPDEGHPPHSMPLVMIGTGILWFGWFGFNAGSAFAANGQAGAGVHEHVPRRRRRRARLGGGRVGARTATPPTSARRRASSPASWPSRPAPASCRACRRSSSAWHRRGRLLLRREAEVQGRLRRRLDVVGVHFVGGLVGSLLIGFFANPEFFGPTSWKACSTAGASACSASSCSPTARRSSGRSPSPSCIMFGLKRTIGVRVDAETEASGLDLHEHEEVAYHGASVY